MAPGGRSMLHEPIPEEAGEQTFLDRVNSFGERHARLIIIISTALIIVTVLIFAQVLWNRTLFDRVERDLTEASSIESLEALRKRYAGSAAEPRILATLGHRYASEGKLAEAKAVYTEFVDKHSGHVLAAGVNRSLAQVNENLKFLETRKEGVANERLLNSHPLHRVGLKDERLQIGPIKDPDPRAVLKFKGKPEEIRLELFEDEAPNAVAAFVSLMQQNYFDGLNFTRVNTDERLRLAPKQENPQTKEIAFERTHRTAEPGLLVMARKGANNASAEFEILIKAGADIKDQTVFGRVFMEGGSAAAGALMRLEEKDVIEFLKVERKRDHEYTPTYVN